MFLFKKKENSSPDMPNKTQKVTTAKHIIPVFYTDLESFSINMHTDSGEKYCFVLKGTYLYSPNHSSTCGYGSDNWMFICKCNDKDCILHFECNAEHCTVWECAYISKEQSELLPKLTETEWAIQFYESKLRVKYLHPDSVESAKQIVKSKVARTGALSDNHFRGM